MVAMMSKETKYNDGDGQIQQHTTITRNNKLKHYRTKKYTQQTTNNKNTRRC